MSIVCSIPLAALVYASPAEALFRDSFSLSLHSYDQEGESQFQAYGGPPPLIWKSGVFFNSLNFRSFTLNPSVVDGDKNIAPSSLSYNGVLRQKMSADWSLVAGLSVGRRNANSELSASYNTLFSSGFIFLNRRWGRHKDSSWSLGMIFLEQTARARVVPGFGFNYISRNRQHRWAFTFPEAGYLYQPSEALILGVYVNYESSAFNLDPNGTLATNSDYQFIAVERANAGLIIRHRLLGSGFWLAGRVGYTFWGETANLKRENPRRLRDKIQTERGFTTVVSLSYLF